MTRTELEESKIHLQSLESSLIEMAKKQSANIIAGKWDEKLDEEIEKKYLSLMHHTSVFLGESKNIRYRDDGKE